MTFRSKLLFAAAVVLLAAGSLFAQGTTGTLTGTVTQDGTSLPGVTVTVSSPNLQGTRSTVTNEAGGYSFGALPPGEYTVRFELAGLTPVTKRQTVGLAQNVRVDADLQVQAVAEAITVTAAAPAVAETQEIQTNFTSKTIENLPVGRTLVAITNLAPGTNNNGVNGISISGAASYDNLYTVNGATVQENLRGQPHNLFIEDAIQETTIQTGAISAEYGNFTGGVVNAITKSGGNQYSGTLRDSLTNNDWTAKSPNTFRTSSTGAVESVPATDPIDKINHVYEGTLGGRIIRDRLWFFGAGRYSEIEANRLLGNSQGTYTRIDENKRYEVKLTGAVTSRHNLVASYLNNESVGGPDCQIGCFDSTALDPDVENPNNFKTAFYNGVLTNNLLVEAKWVEKIYAFAGYGGSDQDRVTGTPVRLTASGFNTSVNEAFFCGSCGDENRDSDQIGLKFTYFLGTRSLGSHNMVLGGENWHETRLSNNFQSPTNFVIRSRTVGPKCLQPGPQGCAPGQTLITLRGNNLTGPGAASASIRDYFEHWPVLQASEGSDLDTNSIYFNDRWDLNEHWQFNLGARYDANDSQDSRGVTVADDSKISPRLGVVYDVFGTGRLRASSSYGVYVGRLAETIAGLGSAAGSPAFFAYAYDGPDIIDVPTEEAVRRFWSWFDSIGGYEKARLVGVNIPGTSRQILESLTSPNVTEYTLGLSTTLSRGFIRADYIHRDWADFYDLAQNLSTGKVTLPNGTIADRGLVVNNDDGLERTYDAIELQTQYRPFTRLNLGLNYTYSRIEANLTGESSGSGPVVWGSTGLYLPEYYNWPSGRNTPVGPADLEDQPHRARLWATYDIPTPVGNFNVSALHRYESGLSYGVFGSVDIRQSANFYGTGKAGGVANPGYETSTIPSSVTYWFETPGTNRWDSFNATDLALNFDTNPRFLMGASLFIQGEVINALNNSAQVGGNRAVLTHRDNAASCGNDPNPAGGCLARFNPAAGDAPVEGVHWVRGPLHGRPTTSTTSTTAGSFQLPRTYRVSLGLRF